MRNIAQITLTAAGLPEPLQKLEIWYDLMEVPASVNNMAEFVATLTKDMPDRKVRVVQLMEGDSQV